MMRLLHWVLAPHSSLPPFPSEWVSPPPEDLHDALFSVLYSDVGSEFYENCGPTLDGGAGWKTTSPMTTCWSVATLAESLAGGVKQEEWRWLSSQEADRAWEADSMLILADVTSKAKAEGKTTFAFLPTEGVGQYNIQRLMSFTPDLQPVLIEPWGVVRQQHGAPLALATWTFEPGTKTMILTRLRATEVELPLLLELLVQAAQGLGKDTIETWNLPGHLADIAERTGGRTFERTDHLSAVMWYGSKPEEQLIWLFNEKSVTMGHFTTELATNAVAGLLGVDYIGHFRSHVQLYVLYPSSKPTDGPTGALKYVSLQHQLVMCRLPKTCEPRSRLLSL